MSNPRLEKLLGMLEKQPDDTFLNYALAMEYLGAGNTPGAIGLFRKVLLIEDHNVAAKYQLARLICQDDPKEAILLLESGMKDARLKSDLKTANEFRSLLDEILFDSEE